MSETDDFLSTPASGVNIRANLEKARELELVPTTREVNPFAVTIDPPSVYPTNLGKILRVDYLASVYLEACKWTEMPEGTPAPDLKAKKFEVKATLKKFADRADAIFDALEAVRDEGSLLSPVFWAWWRISMIMKVDGEAPKTELPSILTVFDPEKLTSGKFRGWFHRDGMARAAEPQVMWPKVAGAILKLWREFERDALDNPTLGPAELGEIWSLCYEPKFLSLKADSRSQRYEIMLAVKRAHERNDLGLWLAEDLVGHLRLRRHATTTLAQE